MMEASLHLFMKTPSSMSKDRNAERLQRLLARRPMRAATILAELNVSQPTFSRLWKSVDNGVVLGAGRSSRYALRRPVSGVAAPIAVYSVDGDGQVDAIGSVDPLQDGFFVLSAHEGSAHTLFEGMPFFMSDLRPQGFLGRLEPGRHRDLDLPNDILRWTDDQVLKYIARRSEQAPGNLIFGDESYARFLAEPIGANAIVAESARTTRYPAMAEHAMQGEPAGSSAGGEQPKFTAVVERGDAAGEFYHVIVKFSPPIDTASGRRWADLLACEHLALEVLRASDIAAAQTVLISAGGRVFLEVVRFDRSGLLGRLPMATFSALDGDLGMMDQNWTAVANALGKQGKLSAADIDTVEILDLFGALIGNTDKHHGNIAVAWSLGRPHTLLPAYDMLPMLYRPTTHGEVVARAWQLDLAAGLALRHLPRCYRMAQAFWRRVLDDERISPAFKSGVAAVHLRNLERLGP
jgi:hypothetical protein